MNGSRIQKSISSIKVRRCGFSLLELLVVISIIAILAGILMPVFSKIKTSGKIRKAESDVRALATAIRAYHLELHKWPGNAEGGTWSNNNYLVIRDLVDNGKRIFFEATTAAEPLLDPFPSNVRTNAYQIKINGDDVTVWSFGMDGTNGGGDDISYSY